MAEHIDGVRFARDGGVARIRLHRPQARNAVNLPMIMAIRRALEEWRDEPLRVITVDSAVDGVFCAGGDIRRVRQNSLEGDPRASDEFFATEYRVNEMLASYPIPVVALIDGVCMGGGLGLSVHGPFRVVTERAVLAMPETAIGFFPDVGASYFLSRLPGGLGLYLGLTGARLSPADALDVGLATHYVKAADLHAVRQALAEEAGPVDAVLRRHVSRPEPSGLARHRDTIDAVFGDVTDLDEVFRRLRHDGSAWARRTLATLEAMSPQSLALTFDLLLWGRQRSLRECLDAERAAARRVVTSPDFLEGVRAVLVDKDRSPRWAASEYLGTGRDGVVRWVVDRS